jgi:hypothetical protein
MSQELQRIHVSTIFFTKTSTQLGDYECHIMMHVVMSVMLKTIFWSMKVRMSPLGNICSVLQWAQSIMLFLYLYPLPDFDWKILPNTSKCVNPRTTRFVFHFFNIWELGSYFQTPGIQYSFLRTSVMNLESQHNTPLPGEGVFFFLFFLWEVSNFCPTLIGILIETHSGVFSSVAWKFLYLKFGCHYFWPEWIALP